MPSDGSSVPPVYPTPSPESTPGRSIPSNPAARIIVSKETREVVVPYNGLPRLSKSRYQAGLQCPKRLWLDCYRRDLADPADEVTQAVFDTGHRVGEVARERFPGILVEEDHTQSEAALRRTEELFD